MAHQSLDATAAHPAALGLQFDMDARAAIASAGIAMDPSDVLDELTIGAIRIIVLDFGFSTSAKRPPVMSTNQLQRP
jgi:hypothetical protein